MSYLSTLLADNAITIWPLQTLTPPPAPPNSDCIDVSGNGFHGTLQPNSVAGLVQGIPGPILTDSPTYGMTGGIARIPSLGPATGALAITGAQSWECWSIYGSAGDAVQMMISANGSEVTNHYLSYGQRSTGNFPGQAYFTLEWPTTARFVTSCVIVPDVWHHVVGTYDGIDTMKLYVDSWLTEVKTTCPPAPTNVPTWRLGYITNLVFGAVYWSSGLAWASLFDYELTPFQIAKHNIAALAERAVNPCGNTVTGGCPVA